MARYEVWVADSRGVRLALVPDVLALRVRRRVNGIGVLGLAIPADSVPLRYFGVDHRLEVWRDNELLTETTWLIQYVAKRLIADDGGAGDIEIWDEATRRRQARRRFWLSRYGQRVIEVGAVSATELLSRRIVAYAAASSEAQKTGAADDLIKAVARENLGSSAGAGRDVSSYLTVEADLSLGATVSKAFAYRNVLAVAQELCLASEEAGTALYFDVVAPTPSTLELRTYTGQRGNDHGPSSPAPVILSPEAGTLVEAERSFDYSQEVTYVLAAGQGLQSDRATTAATDDARAGRSVFGRRELLRDARHVTDSALLQYEADSALRRGLPRFDFSGRVRSVEGAAFGVHWRWGDKVGAHFEGAVLTARVDAIEVRVDDRGEERIRADLQGTEDSG